MSKKKDVAKIDLSKIDLSIEQLKHWKSVSTKGKLEWLESALRFGKLRKF